jgi:hypothetical protein
MQMARIKPQVPGLMPPNIAMNADSADSITCGRLFIIDACLDLHCSDHP